MNKPTIRFISTILDGKKEIIYDIKEVNPKKLSRNQFDSSTNFCLESSIDFLDKNSMAYRVYLEVVPKKS